MFTFTVSLLAPLNIILKFWSICSVANGLKLKLPAIFFHTCCNGCQHETTLLPSDVIDFAMLPAQRFWRETVSLLDVMRLRSNQSDQVVRGCKTFLQKVETSSTSCNTICTCCAFYRPKANLFWCFVANDATPVYGLTPAYQKSEFTCNLTT